MIACYCCNCSCSRNPLGQHSGNWIRRKRICNYHTWTRESPCTQCNAKPSNDPSFSRPGLWTLIWNYYAQEHPWSGTTFQWGVCMMRVYYLPFRITRNTHKQTAACLYITGLGCFASFWSKLAVNSERHVDLEPKEIPAGGQQCPFLVNSSLNNLLSNEAKYVLAWHVH